MYSSSFYNLFSTFNNNFTGSKSSSWYSTLDFLSKSPNTLSPSNTSWYSTLNNIGSALPSSNNYFSSKYTIDYSFTGNGNGNVNLGSLFDTDLTDKLAFLTDTSKPGNSSVRGLKETNGTEDHDTILTENSGTFSTIHGFDGNDIITVLNEAFSAMYGDAGNDVFVFGKDSSGVIRGGDGTDSVDISDYVNTSTHLVNFSDLSTDQDGSISFKTDKGVMTVKPDTEFFNYTTQGNQKVSVSYSELKKLIADNNTEQLQNTGNIIRNGTENGNYISVTNGNKTKFNLLAGDDVLTVVNSTGLSADLGTGKDISSVDHTTQTTLNGNDGDDELWSKTSSLIGLYGGAGNDKLIAENGTGANVLVGDLGNDIFNVTNEKSVSMTGGSGDDIFSIDTKSAGFAEGGTGSDLVNLSVGYMKSGKVVDTNKVKLNDKNEIVLLNDNGAFVLKTDIESIKFSNATDAYTFNALSQQVVQDSLKKFDNITGQTYTGSQYVENIIAKNGSNNIFNFQNSVDLLNLQNQTNTNASLGGNADVLYGTTLNGNTINGQNGDDYINIKESISSMIHGGNDKDTITLYNGSTNTIFGGEGDDVLVIANEKGMKLSADNGNDSLSVDALSTGTISGGAGVDNILLNNGEKLASFGGFKIGDNGEIVFVNENGSLTLNKDIENIVYIDDKGASISKTHDQFKEIMAQNPTLYANLAGINVLGSEFGDNLKTTNVLNGQYTLGGGNDTIEFDNKSTGSVSGGLGVDTVTLANMFNLDGSLDYSKFSFNSKNEMIVKNGDGFIVLKEDVENIKIKKTNGTLATYSFEALKQNILARINNGSLYTNIVTGQAGIFNMSNQMNAITNGSANNDMIVLNKFSSGRVGGGAGEDSVNLTNLFDTSLLTPVDYVNQLKTKNQISVNSLGQIVLETETGKVILSTDIEKFIFSGNAVNFMTYDDVKLALAA